MVQGGCEGGRIGERKILGGVGCRWRSVILGQLQRNGLRVINFGSLANTLHLAILQSIYFNMKISAQDSVT